MAPSTTTYRRSLATTVTSWGACATGGKFPMPVAAYQRPTSDVLPAPVVPQRPTGDRDAIRLRAR